MTHHTAEHRDPAMNACIEQCKHCHSTCLETINYCLGQGGRHAEPQHITLMMVCADICGISARAMLLGSQAHVATCRACAEICRLCAESCESMGDDAEMQRCAEVCRQCAASCSAMAGMV